MPLLKRSTLSGLVAIVVLLAGLSAPTAQAYEVVRADEKPSELATMGDFFIARPLLIGATALGWAAFTISLPASALGGNIDQAAEKLVKKPARSAFLRCLGCTPVQHEWRASEKRTQKKNGQNNN